MNAEIIAVGDEILIGQIVNNNAAEIGQALAGAGIDPIWATTVGDELDRIVSALEIAFSRADLVVLTGGIGPTHDDRTKDALAVFFNRSLVLNEPAWTVILDRYRSAGKSVPDFMRRQAMVPEGCEIIANPIGSAQGMLLERDGRMAVSLPGVPMEMRAMLHGGLIPLLARRQTGRSIQFEKIKTFGIWESELFQKLDNLADIESFAKIAFLPRASGVELRISVDAESPASARARISEARKMILSRLKPWIVSIGDQSLEEVTAALLQAGGLTLAVAESCTGGLLAHKFTNIPGSSEFFLGGVVSYDNSIKTGILGVDPELIETHGAVSREVALAMAAGMRQRSGADIAIATTGIAGPGGGTEDKPVGLLWTALDSAVTSHAEKYLTRGDRLYNKERFASACMNLLRRYLQQPLQAFPESNTC